jgi:large subunit ribosomal protein L25
MPEMRTLDAKPRDLAATPRALRREGWIPGVLYGYGYDSRSLQFDEHTLQQIIRSVGTTRLLDLSIEGESQREIVLVRDLQRDSVSGRLLHIDLYRTIAGQAITSTVPLIAVGEAPAVELGGVAHMLLDQLEIECLPRDLPDSITVDLGALTEMDSAILISDLDIPTGVTVLGDMDAPVARMVVPRAAIELEAEEEAEAALVEEAEAVESAEEAGEAPAGEADAQESAE